MYINDTNAVVIMAMLRRILVTSLNDFERVVARMLMVLEYRRMCNRLSCVKNPTKDKRSTKMLFATVSRIKLTNFPANEISRVYLSEKKNTDLGEIHRSIVCSTWVVHHFFDGRRCELTTVSVQPERCVEQDIDDNSDKVPKTREKPERIDLK